MSKSMHTARHFSRIGWRVVAIEHHKYWMSGTRFSNCVDAFHTVPPPDEDLVGYLKAMRRILAKEKADIYMPTSTALLEVRGSILEVKQGSVLGMWGHEALERNQGIQVKVCLERDWRFPRGLTSASPFSCLCELSLCGRFAARDWKRGRRVVTKPHKCALDVSTFAHLH